MTITIFGRQFSINIILLSFLFLGVIFKGIYLYSYALNNPYYSIASMDSAVYVNWAQLINQEGWLGTETFYRAPFYPYLLSIIFWFAPNNLLAVYIMQLVMGICSVIFIYSIGKRIYCERAGLIAAGFSLVYSPLTFFETKILPTITGEAVRELEKIIVSESQDYRLYIRAGTSWRKDCKSVRKTLIYNIIMLWPVP